jgi:hypothetical protein
MVIGAESIQGVINVRLLGVEVYWLMVGQVDGR